MPDILALVAADTGLWAGGPDGLAFVPYPAAAEVPAPEAGAPAVSPLSPQTREAAPAMTSSATVPADAPVTALFLTDRVLFVGGIGTIARRASDPASERPADTCRVPGGFGPVADFGTDGSGTLFAATLEDGVLRSTDGGRTWVRSGYGLPGPEVMSLVTAADGAVFAGTPDGVFRARAGGRAWQVCPGTEGAPVASMVLLPQDGTVVAATEDGTVLRSADDGVTWATADAPKNPTALAPSPGGGLVLATAGEGVHHSPDAGATWLRDSPDPAVRTVHCLAATDRAVHAGTSDGVAVSPGPGLPWRPLVPATPRPEQSKEHA
ncbi:hypothetical protein H1V43_30815 [Streptomyces sp. PSKA54]|uniref:Exo-alpha-sialidase n=1 Tax=Streptomyces himalayensis subsp. aureolus TaxID=2758039 RepID=A0A7W2D6G1_9ACTN|nr:hypothetical protein [Streptomyces himalayensis]MBA4865656.1 hypothetical protein [Streptomyces himalayensis subsp. aureolus]